MKRWYLLAFASLLLAVVSLFRLPAEGAHTSPAGQLSIATFLHDSPAAVSFTFDDGLQSHIDLAAPLLEEFNFRGTFYVVPGRMRERTSDRPSPDPRFRFGEAAISWQEVQSLHHRGHEIANHSLTHNFMNQMSPRDLLAATLTSSQLIQQHLGQAPLTFAYPYNEWNTAAHNAVLQNHIAVRESWTPYGSLKNKPFSAQIANQFVLHALQHHQWLVPMIHGIDGGFMPLQSADFRSHLAFLQQHPEVWVAPYADVFRYISQRDNSRLTRLQDDPHSLTFTLTSPLDPAIYCLPLTIIVPLPLAQDTDEIQVLQEESPLPFTREKTRILLNVPPTSTPIQITWH